MRLYFFMRVLVLNIVCKESKARKEGCEHTIACKLVIANKKGYQLVVMLQHHVA